MNRASSGTLMSLVLPASAVIWLWRQLPISTPSKLITAIALALIRSPVSFVIYLTGQVADELLFQIAQAIMAQV